MKVQEVKSVPGGCDIVHLKAGRPLHSLVPPSTNRSTPEVHNLAKRFFVKKKVQTFEGNHFWDKISLERKEWCFERISLQRPLCVHHPNYQL